VTVAKILLLTSELLLLGLSLKIDFIHTKKATSKIDFVTAKSFASSSKS